MQLLHEMEEDGSTPDTAAFEAALDALKDAAQWERAMDLISEMDELGVRESGQEAGLGLHEKKGLDPTTLAVSFEAYGLYNRVNNDRWNFPAWFRVMIALPGECVPRRILDELFIFPVPPPGHDRHVRGSRRRFLDKISHRLVLKTPLPSGGGR